MTTEARTPRRGPGRRPGSPDTRSAILAAAKQEFATKGYDRTSMRGVGRAADVDPALVHHYFASKDDLFLESLELPFDPRVIVPEWTEEGTDELGRQIITRFLLVWDHPETRQPLETLLRSAMVSDAAANALSQGLARMIIGPLSAALGTPDAKLRAQLVASHLVGLGVARYIVGLEPIASTPSDEVARRVAPVLQGYLTGPVPEPRP